MCRTHRMRGQERGQGAVGPRSHTLTGDGACAAREWADAARSAAAGGAGGVRVLQGDAGRWSGRVVWSFFLQSG